MTKEKKDDDEDDGDEDDGDEEMRMKNEHRLADDPANWWAPDSACVPAMVRSAGFDVEAQITHETWMCTASRSPHRFITRELDAIRRR